MQTRFLSLIAALPLVAGLILPASAGAAAGPQLNKNAADREFLTGRNITTGQTDPTDPVYANASQEVEVNVYYHNTGNPDDAADTAKNVKVAIALPTTASTTQVLTGTLSADNATSTTGTIVSGVETGKPGLTIMANSAVTTSFVAGSLRWYPDQMATTGAGAALPNNQTGDTIVTTGINLGDIKACFARQGVIKFKVKLAGQVVNPARIDIKKHVRKAGGTTFLTENTVAAGDKVDYRLTVTNQDGAASAYNVTVKDTLPAGVTYVGPTSIRYADGTSKNVADGITAAGLLIDELKPQQVIEIFFQATMPATGVNNGDCKVNEVVVTGAASSITNSGEKASAKTCLTVTSTPTPSPSSTPTPTAPPPSAPVVKSTPTPAPKVELPKTGGEAALLLGGAGFASAALVAMRQIRHNAKAGKSAKRGKGIDVL
jgi:uncharacterized repeat protein (TIGR01451 family)